MPQQLGSAGQHSVMASGSVHARQVSGHNLGMQLHTASTAAWLLDETTFSGGGKLGSHQPLQHAGLTPTCAGLSRQVRSYAWASTASPLIVHTAVEAGVHDAQSCGAPGRGNARSHQI